MKTAVIPERDVLKVCMDYLATIPRSRFYRRNTGAIASMYKGKRRYIRYGKRGMADLWGIWEGRHVEIEIKRKGEEPNLDQLAWIEDCRSVGSIAFWVDSVDMLIEKLAGFSSRNAF